MPYCQVCLVRVKLSVSVSASVNLDVKTICVRLSVKITIGLALPRTIRNHSILFCKVNIYHIHHSSTSNYLSLSVY